MATKRTTGLNKTGSKITSTKARKLAPKAGSVAKPAAPAKKSKAWMLKNP